MPGQLLNSSSQCHHHPDTRNITTSQVPRPSCVSELGNLTTLQQMMTPDSDDDNVDDFVDSKNATLQLTPSMTTLSN